MSFSFTRQTNIRHAWAFNSLLLLEAVDERNQYSGLFPFGGIDAVEEFLCGYGGQRVCRGISLSGEIFL